MKKCEHCSKDCSRRIAVKHKGKILMVGTACSKKFKRAKTKDLLHDSSLSDAIAGRIMSHGGDPSKYKIDRESFSSRFKYEPDSNGIEFYNWNGYGVTLSRTRDKFKLHVYDPYSSKRGTEQVGEIIYEDVSKALTPGRRLSVAPNYEYNVVGIKDPPDDINDENKGKILEWVDEFTKWDPIKKYGFELKYDAVPASSMYSYKKLSPTTSVATLTTATAKHDPALLNESRLSKALFISEENASKLYLDISIVSKNSNFLSCSFDSCLINISENSLIDNENSNNKISGCKLYLDQSKITNCTIENSNISNIVDFSLVDQINFNNCSFTGIELNTITGKTKFFSSSGRFFKSEIFKAVFSGRTLFENCLFDRFTFNEIIISDSILFRNCYFKDCVFSDFDIKLISFINCNFGSDGLKLDNILFDTRYPITSINCIGTIHGASINPNTGVINK